MQVQIALLTSKIVIVPDRVARMPQVLGDCPLRLTTAQAIYDVRYAVQVESLHFCPPHLSTTHVESKGLLMAATHVSKVVQFTRPRVVHIGRPWVVHTARPRPVQTTRPSLVQYSPAGDISRSTILSQIPVDECSNHCCKKQECSPTAGEIGKPRKVCKTKCKQCMLNSTQPISLAPHQYGKPNSTNGCQC